MTDEGLLLLKACHGELYRNNAFRLLGLPVDAAARDVNVQLKSIVTKRRLGDETAGGDGLLARLPPASEEELRHAAEALHDPASRLVQELFWFWPMEAGQAAADPALQALRAGKLSEACRIWEAQEQDGTADVARHNRAVFHHFSALNGESQAHQPEARARETSLALRVGVDASGELQDAANAAAPETLEELWSQALRCWLSLCGDDRFWDRLAQRIRRLDDRQLTDATAARMREAMAPALLSINANLAVQAAEAGQQADARRHVKLIEQSGFPVESINEALRRAADPIVERVKSLCARADADARNDTEPAIAVGERLLSESQPHLAAIDMLLAPGDATRDGVHDEVVSVALRCQIQFGNRIREQPVEKQVEQWQACLDQLEKLRQTASGDTARARMEENSVPVRSNLAYSWCRRADAEANRDPLRANLVAEGLLKDVVPLLPETRLHYGGHMAMGAYGVQGMLANSFPASAGILDDYWNKKSAAPDPNEAVHDEVALCALSCAVIYGNFTKDWVTTWNLLKKIQPLPATKAAWERIAENAKIVTDNMRYSQAAPAPYLGSSQPNAAYGVPSYAPPAPRRQLSKDEIAAREKARRDEIEADLGVKQGKACPKCGFSYGWDGVRCRHCQPAPYVPPAPPKVPPAPPSYVPPATSCEPPTPKIGDAWSQYAPPAQHDPGWERNRSLDVGRKYALPPAIALMILGGLTFARRLFNIGSLFDFDVAEMVESVEENFYGDGWFFSLLLICAGVFICVGGFKMKSMRSHGMAKAAGIVAIVGGIVSSLNRATLDSVLGIGVGIWALVVLRKPEVGDAFRWASDRPQAPPAAAEVRSQLDPGPKTKRSLEIAGKLALPPALALMILGGLAVALGLFSRVASFAENARPDGWLWFLSPLLVCSGVFIGVGGFLMKSMRFHGVCLAAAVVAIVTAVAVMASFSAVVGMASFSGIVCFTVLGIGIGIWAIVILREPEVADAFRRASNVPPTPPASDGVPSLSGLEAFFANHFALAMLLSAACGVAGLVLSAVGMRHCKEPRARSNALLCLKFSVVFVALAVVSDSLYVGWRSSRGGGHAVHGDELIDVLNAANWRLEGRDFVDKPVLKRLGAPGRMSGDKVAVWPQQGLAVRFENPFDPKGGPAARVFAVVFGWGRNDSPDGSNDRFYRGPFPYGLKKGDTPARVAARLGPRDPVSEQKGGQKSFPSDYNYHETFRRGAVTVHFRDGGLISVTVYAPRTVPSPPLSGQALLNLPGKKTDSPEFLAFCKTVAGQTMLDRDGLPGSAKFQTFNGNSYGGVEVEVAAAPAAGHAVAYNLVNALVLKLPYAGELPGGIRFGDSREEVHKKLGTPPQAVQFSDRDIYADKGLQVGYDQAGKVQSLRISVPDKQGSP